MAFGQSPGPPATAQQMRRLESLIWAAGHVSFREARGPLGLTQRQAGGKFTRNEADELIAQLEIEVGEAEGENPAAAAPATTPAAPSPEHPAVKARPKRATPARGAVNLAGVASEALAAELQSRGWVVMEP